MPLLGALSGARSFFGSRLVSRQPTPVVASRDIAVSVEAKRICEVTGKKRNKANKVCFSNKKSRTFQEVNLQVRHILVISSAVCRGTSCAGHMAATALVQRVGVPHAEEAPVLGEGAAMGFVKAVG